MAIHGNTWLYMAVYGITWLYMDIPQADHPLLVGAVVD